MIPSKHTLILCILSLVPSLSAFAISGTTTDEWLSSTNTSVHQNQTWIDTGRARLQPNSSKQSVLHVYGTAILNEVVTGFSGNNAMIYIYDGGHISANDIRCVDVMADAEHKAWIGVQEGGTFTLKATSQKMPTMLAPKQGSGDYGVYIEDLSGFKIDLSDYPEPTDTDIFLINLITNTENAFVSLISSGSAVERGGKSASSFEFSEKGMQKWNTSFIENISGFEEWQKEFVFSSENNGTLVLKLSKIPEPSAFGLLAGLGALALVGARRRRR